MPIKTMTVAAALILGLSGAALAQGTQPGTAGASDPAMRGGQGTDRSMNRMDPNTMPGSTGSTGRGTGNMGGGTGTSSNTGVGLGNQGANQGARQ